MAFKRPGLCWQTMHHARARPTSRLQYQPRSCGGARRVGFGVTTSGTSAPPTSTSVPAPGTTSTTFRFPVDTPGITLLDPNPEVLRYTSHRLRRYTPMVHAADALQPIALEPDSFGSAALGYVLHCLPGDLTAKAVFDQIAPLVVPGGVLFGTTILKDGVHYTRLGRRLLRLYNDKGIFSNLEDDLEGLRQELGRRFDRYEVDVIGAVALFAAQVP